ncbi:MAG: LamG domain-containing protein [Acidobacteria bacterium]|nr:LamG domain-containing protein [Acidobacteriota bacterium]MCI0626222.1 LamG domain-containing protein [Acidobacteriota bacterium]MCI0717633.1 LamG domain-containing protein [Acidobacteriota bacterium]
MKKKALLVALLSWAVLNVFDPIAAGNDALRKALTFHASFDRVVDADFAAGSKQLYTATSYKKREDAKPGLHHPDVHLAAGAGRFGGALRFAKKNTKAVYYSAEKNVAYQPSDWNGTVSFWLSLDPETDLEPGYCDPIQVTDEDYNDAALWVDFTKDDKPRHFRLGVFGDLKTWNPQNLPPDKNPDFLRRLVVVQKTPFARGRWTHVVVTHKALGGSQGGVAKLYLNGALQGATPVISEPFGWNLDRAAIRLGVNYVGLFDDLAVFNRELSAQEVKALHQLKDGVKSLKP